MDGWRRNAGILLALAALGGPSPGWGGAVPAPAGLGDLHPGPTSGQDGLEAFERGLREAREELVERMMELAAWCHGNKLFATRLEVLRSVVTLSPDHPEARRELGYKRGRDGQWQEPRPTRAPKDHDPGALPEARRRIDTIGEPFRERVIALLERHADELSPERRRAALRQLVETLPGDPKVRALVGEVSDRGQWVLAETARGRRVRAELRPLVRRLLAEAEAEPRAVEPNSRERAFDLPFIGAWRTSELRVLATTDQAEALRVAAALTAARPLLNALFSMEAAYDPEATVYLLADPTQGDQWLERNPDLTEAQRRFNAQLEGCSVLGTRAIAYWPDDVRRRVDGVVRLAIAGLLRDGVGLTMKQGLLSEGLGLYLTRELVGTRLTWFVQPSTYLQPEEDQRLRNMLLDPAVNWMNEAHVLLQRPDSPKLQFLIGKDVSRLTTEDLLVSYAAGAYLLEGWPDELPLLLRRVSEGEPPQVVIEEVLGYDVLELDARMRRWLGERR